jgi:hypothetical protein
LQWETGWDGVGVILADPVDMLPDDPTRLSDAARALCLDLLEGSPQPSLCGGGKWRRLALQPNGCSLASSTWATAQLQADRADAAGVRTTLYKARSEYSPAGWRILRAGVLDLLAARVEEGQEP